MEGAAYQSEKAQEEHGYKDRIPRMLISNIGELANYAGGHQRVNAETEKWKERKQDVQKRRFGEDFHVRVNVQVLFLDDDQIAGVGNQE